MGEIGDFSAFLKPKQLFAYFGLDPAVKQSGKFEGTKVQMSKRGSVIARRVIHVLTLQSNSISRNGEAKNPVLRDYYLKKCESKPKLVAMGAVSHKVCNMLFAILRDNKPFEIITPQEHIKQYHAAKCDIAAWDIENPTDQYLVLKGYFHEEESLPFFRRKLFFIYLLTFISWTYIFKYFYSNFINFANIFYITY